jgi:hypothetical protein
MRYSPNVGEEEFCELRLYGILGSSLAINISKIVHWGVRRTPINAIMRWWVSANRQGKAGGVLVQIDEA